MIEKIISHMNEHHQKELIALAKKFGAIKEIKKITLDNVDTKGLDILCDKKTIRVDFPQEVTIPQLKEAIIELCQSVEKSIEEDKIKSEILDFRDSFGSVMIASVDKEGQAIASYAPLLRYEGRFFIYISEVAEHYHSIKANPNKIEVLFLEDECKAKSVILRKRLRYKARAEFREKDSEFEKIFSSFELSHPHAGGLSTIKGMQDFHLVELIFKEGRYVKGFGGAYDINERGEVSFAMGNNPHKFPHK